MYPEKSGSPPAGAVDFATEAFGFACFAGSETGIFYSLDDGENWERFNINLPAVPVVDIKVKDSDLVIATNGRGFWVLDDITPLRTKSAEIDAAPVHLYPIPDHTRFGYNWWLDYVPGGDPGDKKNYFVQNMRPDQNRIVVRTAKQIYNASTWESR